MNEKKNWIADDDKDFLKIKHKYYKCALEGAILGLFIFLFIEVRVFFYKLTSMFMCAQIWARGMKFIF